MCHTLNPLTMYISILLQVTFAQISSHSIRGVVDRIEFKNCVIKSIRPFAIGVADPLAYLISMDSTIIHKLESQVIWMKLFNKTKIQRYSCARNESVQHANQLNTIYSNCRRSKTSLLSDLS